MTELISVRAVEGRNSLMEDGSEWPEGSIDVAYSHYIRRRLRDGDIVKVEATKADKVTPKDVQKGDKGEK